MEKGTGHSAVLRVAVLLAGLLLAGACAAPIAGRTPVPGSDLSQAPGPAPSGQTRAASGEATRAAHEIFLTGYAAIAGKYIGTVTPGELASEGLRGLAAIDPALTIRMSEDQIGLYRDGILIARHETPPGDNVEAWAGLSVALIEAAKAASPDMDRAPAERIFEAVFDAALSNLDIFSRYAGAEEARKNRAKRDGFGGIGLHFRKKDNGLLITKIIKDSPADKAGLTAGDVIAAINGTPTDDMSARIAGRLLRGPVLSQVEITIQRAAEGTGQKPAATPYPLTLTRTHIIPDTVTARLEDGLLYLRVQSFNRKTARAVNEHIETVRTAKGAAAIEGIILDLRGNPGGLLRQSIEVADLFLAEGRIMSTAGRHPDSVQVYRANGKDTALGLPVAVIVDGKSASAAEVVAAALQDQGRAVVIGATSYGKGTVQTVIRLPNDGEITLTWSRLIAPSGYAFHGLGVPPVICTSQQDAAGTDRGEGTLAAADLMPPPATADALQAWRQLGHQDPVAGTGTGARADRRRDLRAGCPPERLYAADMPVPGQRDRETRIAALVLKDQALYARALKLSLPPTDTAAMVP